MRTVPASTVLHRRDADADPATGGVAVTGRRRAMSPVGAFTGAAAPAADAAASAVADIDARVRAGRAITLIAERRVDAHEHLYLEGQRQSHVYLVLEGVVGRYKLLPDGRRQITSFAYPGDMIGLDCPQVHVDSAEALDRVSVRAIPLNAIDRLLASEPGFAQALLRVAAAELADTREQMVSLGKKSAAEKLAGFLLRVSRRGAALGDTGEVIRLPMKRAEIADFLGLTIETVSRQFTRLRETGVIRLASATEVHVLDPARLEAVAEGHGSERVH